MAELYYLACTTCKVRTECVYGIHTCGEATFHDKMELLNFLIKHSNLGHHKNIKIITNGRSKAIDYPIDNHRDCHTDSSSNIIKVDFSEVYKSHKTVN